MNLTSSWHCHRMSWWRLCRNQGTDQIPPVCRSATECIFRRISPRFHTADSEWTLPFMYRQFRNDIHSSRVTLNRQPEYMWIFVISYYLHDVFDAFMFTFRCSKLDVSNLRMVLAYRKIICRIVFADDGISAKPRANRPFLMSTDVMKTRKGNPSNADMRVITRGSVSLVAVK